MSAKHDRLGQRYGRLVLLLSGSIISFILALVLFVRFWVDSGRMSVLLVDNPVLLWSYDGQNSSFTAVTVPVDIVIPGSVGYGTYSVDALWKLGQIEKKSGKLLAASIQDAFAVPVPYYLAPQALPGQSRDIRAIVRDAFSPVGIWKFVTGKVQTNMNAVMFLRFTKISRFVRWERVTVLDSRDVTNPLLLADASVVAAVDSARSDRMLASEFEDSTVRREALRVAVYNTGSTAGLAQKVSRMLTNAGALVVSVENREVKQHSGNECTITSSTEQIAKSQTVRFITAVFGCKQIAGASGERSDIEVFISSLPELK